MSFLHDTESCIQSLKSFIIPMAKNKGVGMSTTLLERKCMSHFVR